MARVVGIDHIVLRASDFEVSRRFYDRLLTFLGFVEEWDLGLDHPDHGHPVVPAHRAAKVPFLDEAQEGQQPVVEPPRDLEVRDAQDDVVDADDAGHGRASIPGRNIAPAADLVRG